MEERKNRIGRKGRQNRRNRREESKQKRRHKEGEEEKKKKDKVTCSFATLARRRSDVHPPCVISFLAYSVGLFM